MIFLALLKVILLRSDISRYARSDILFALNARRHITSRRLISRAVRRIELAARRIELKKARSRALFSGDPYGIRTHVTAVKGRCLNHLTNGPF